MTARGKSVRGEFEVPSPPPDEPLGSSKSDPTAPRSEGIRRWRRRIWRMAKLYWKTVAGFAVSFAGALAGIASAVALVWIGIILVHDVTQPTITISDITVPDDLAKRGFTPSVVANRLRDALNDFGRAGDRLVKHAELALPDDTTQIVVPALGLPLATVATATSKMLALNNNRALSGELTVRGGTLFLRLRLNERVIYENSTGVSINDPDLLFKTAARAVFERTEPYTVAAYLYNQHLVDQVYDETSGIIARLPATDPNVVEAYYLRGYVSSARHRLELAAQDFRTSIRLDPTFFYAHDGLASVYEQQNQQRAAADEYIAAIRLNSRTAYPHVLLGNYYWRQGNVAAARDELKAAVEVGPQNEWTHNNLGDFYRNTRAPGQAIAEYRTAVELASLDNRTDNQAVYAHLQLGNLYDEEQRRGEAIAEFTAATFLDPTSIAAHTGLADLYISADNRDEAVREYRAVLRLDPKDVHAHTRLGDLYDAETERGRAVSEYRIALRLDPKNGEAHNNLGALYAHEGNVAQAVDEYHTAIRLTPTPATPHANLGAIALQKGRHDEAKREFQIALRLDRSNAPAHSGLGKIALQAGQLEAAEDDYRAAIRFDPRLWDAHLGLGTVSSQRGDYRRALAEYDAAIRLSPMHAADAYLGRGLIAFGNGDFGTAIAALSHTIALDPRNATALSIRGLAFVETGQIARGKADADDAIAIDRSAALGFLTRGMAEELSGDTSRANRDSALAIAASDRKKNEPRDATTYLLRGMAFVQLGRIGPAVINYTRALQINPDMTAAYVNQSMAYFLLHDYSDSLADANRAVTLAPGSAMAYLMRSHVREASGANALAIADANRALALSPTPDAYLVRGDNYLKLRKYRAAIADFSRTIALHSELGYAFNARSAAFLESGDYQHGLADATSALANNPPEGVARAEFRVGAAHFALARFAAAGSDFSQSVHADPKYVYAALWLQLTDWKIHNNRPTAALGDARIDVRPWPGPVVRLFAGKATPADVLAAAARSTAPDHGPACEAAFYVGEYALAHADRVRAQDQLRRAAATCPPGYDEAIAAKAELAHFAR